MSTKPAPNKSKATPAPQTTRLPSRNEMLALLASKGYEGPTSFTASTLRDVIAWFEVGCPKDATTIPTGVLFAVHPDLKPLPKSKASRLTKFQQGYQQALAEVAGLSTLASVQKWVEDNRAEVEA